MTTSGSEAVKRYYAWRGSMNPRQTPVPMDEFVLSSDYDALARRCEAMELALEYIRDLGADGADKKYMRAQSKAEHVLDARKVTP